ncbi:hypothetical protein QQ045_014891 [Rhodiola kirilowii]
MTTKEITFLTLNILSPGHGWCWHNQPPDPDALQLATPTVNGAWNGGARSFVVVTKTKADCPFPTINIAACQYGTKDGKPSISITTAELQVGIENLKQTLLAKFSGRRPPIKEVCNSFTEVWSLSGKCSIGAWDAKHVLIVLDSETDARKVLAHPMRKLEHVLFRIFRWSKDFRTKRESTTITMWIRLPHLPPELYNPGDRVWLLAKNNIQESPSLLYQMPSPWPYNFKLPNMKMQQEHEQRIWAACDEYGLLTGKPKGAAPQEKQKEVKSLSLAKEGQSSFSADEKNAGWKVVHKRKGKQNNKNIPQDKHMAVLQQVNHGNALI